MNLIGNINAIPFRRFRGGGGVSPIPPFPSISGMIARYSALGLTNEEMSKNPVWVDKTGNGHDLQMKNFAWKGMSGVGGYTENYDSNRWYKVLQRIDTTWTYKSFNVKSIKDNNVAQLFYQSLLSDTGFRVLSCTIKVSGLTDGQGIEYVSNGTQQFVIMRIENDGIYHLPSFDFGAKNAYYGFKFLKLQESCNITIEQLPLYPGALVFDGVDDWAGCDNLPLLPKEKGYSIIALRNWITRYDATQYKRPLISNLDTNDEGAFLIEYRKDENVNDVTGSYNSFTDVYIDDNNPITWQTSSSYNGQIIKKGTSKSTNKLCICKTYFVRLSNYANAAIWEIVILDHDATEEELTKIKDYFVKTYPWLFFDQAWTVTGKTNEDEDRATIANITGNGNDLVLSNFAFSGNSGYGEYAYNFNDTSWISIPDYGVISDKTSKSFNIKSFVLADYPVLYTAVNKDSSIKKVKIKVTNSIPGFYFGNKPSNQIIDLSTDGIYEIPSYNSPNDVTQYGFRCSNVNDSCNITIEQIPEYEGYLITDGVDDEIISAKPIKFADKFTIVGDWKFMEDRNDNAGLLKANQIYIYNATTGMRIYLKQGSKNYPFSCKKINALTSDGWVYDEKWDKYKVYPIGSNIDISIRLFLGFYSSNFTKIALKNLGIYNNQILSKDDCIKAYNYLQTLKAK